MCGTAAGVGVTGVADAGARLLLFARRLRREPVRGGGVEDVDQLAIFFWYAVPRAVINNTTELVKRVLTGRPLWSWRGISLILGATGGMRELADGLP